jgi:septal ring factor EnvC (AmiA/AmiB activator)
MATTLFAIFAIALVATLAWIISRIVNIFVELEELNEQAVYLKDDIEALEEKVKDLEKKVNQHTQAQALIVEHQGKVDELMAKAAEGEKKTSECLKLLEENLEIIIAYLDNERAKANKPSEAHKEKMDRVAKYIVLRGQGLSIRKAGEEVGVAYVTAKRYERIRKETKQWE